MFPHSPRPALRSFSSSLFLAVAVLGAAASTVSCAGENEASKAGATVTQTIGAAGGTIEVEGAVVRFPAGALAADKVITISASSAGPPEGYVALSKVFTCGPSGTDFAEPVSMTMPFVDDGNGAVTMFWSSGADPAFKDVGGVIEGTRVVTTVRHFSSGFVGRKK